MENQLEINILFNAQVNPGNFFALKILDENNKEFEVRQEFVEKRIGPNQTEIGRDLNATADNLLKTLQLDYRSIFEAKRVASGVNLISLKDNLVLDDIVLFPVGIPINVNPTYGPSTIYKVDSVTFLQASDSFCNKVKIRVKTNQPTANYYIGNNSFQVNTNQFEFDYYRGSLITVKMKNYIGVEITRQIIVPHQIEDMFSHIQLQVINSINGGSVTAVVPYASTLNPQFSLDNVNFQTSNTFGGLLEGSYTLYIKDAFGCLKTKNFTIEPFVNNIVQLNNLLYVSKSNSIRFAERVDFDFFHKTDENTLSCEVDVIKPYKQIQVFKEEIITTQFKSNYDINRAVVIDGLDEHELVILKKTNNINLKDKRSATKYNLGNGKVGIFFTSGDIYDFDTNAVIGSYQLNGYLPEWAKKGNVFSLDNIWYNIHDIYFDESKNADIIIINSIYIGGDTQVLTAAQYNRENYDVYEFSIDMSVYLNRNIKVKILGSSTDLNHLQEYLSEEIHVQKNIENSLEIRYKNTKNTDVLYSTGIEHLIRIPYDLNSGKDVNLSENHKTDDKVLLLESSIYESNNFKFEPLTKELWRKLKIALSHDIVYIDGVGYVKEEDFETEGPLGQTNLYVLSVTMTKNGQIYSIKNSNDNIIIGNDNEIPEIIGFIDNTDNGFIQY